MHNLYSHKIPIVFNDFLSFVCFIHQQNTRLATKISYCTPTVISYTITATPHLERNRYLENKLSKTIKIKSLTNISFALISACFVLLIALN